MVVIVFPLGSAASNCCTLQGIFWPSITTSPSVGCLSLTFGPANSPWNPCLTVCGSASKRFPATSMQAWISKVTPPLSISTSVVLVSVLVVLHTWPCSLSVSVTTRTVFQAPGSKRPQGWSLAGRAAVSWATPASGASPKVAASVRVQKTEGCTIALSAGIAGQHPRRYLGQPSGRHSIVPSPWSASHALPQSHPVWPPEPAVSTSLTNRPGPISSSL